MTPVVRRDPEHDMHEPEAWAYEVRYGGLAVDVLVSQSVAREKQWWAPQDWAEQEAEVVGVHLITAELARLRRVRRERNAIERALSMLSHRA